MNLKDKTVVITGATSGIGKSLALFFLKEGAKVVASSHKAEHLESLKKEADIDTFLADVRLEKDVQSLAKHAVEKFGTIDLWINNAGVFSSFSSDDEFVDMEKAHQIIDTNLFGSIFGTRAAIRAMKSVGHGSIVTILSTAALDATRAKNAKIYAASKWALRGYLQSVEAENDGTGVSFYSVYPGGTQTELYTDNKPEAFNEYMTADSVAEKIIANLKQEQPERELVIKRPKP